MVEPSTPPVSERPTFLVHRINAVLANICNPVFSEFDVDILSSRILAVISELKNPIMGDIVDIMVLPQSTISHQVKRLEKRGLVKRTRRAEDNRSVAVTLTDKGIETARICSLQSEMIYAELSNIFSPEELESLHDLLGKMFGGLQKMPPLILNGTAETIAV